MPGGSAGCWLSAGGAGERLRPEPRPRGVDSAWKGPPQLRFSEHLLRARRWAGSCPGIVSFNSSHKSCEVGAINSPILQMKKWRLRDEVTSFIHIYSLFMECLLCTKTGQTNSDHIIITDLIITGIRAAKKKRRVPPVRGLTVMPGSQQQQKLTLWGHFLCGQMMG